MIPKFEFRTLEGAIPVLGALIALILAAIGIGAGVQIGGSSVANGSSSTSASAENNASDDAKTEEKPLEKPVEKPAPVKDEATYVAEEAEDGSIRLKFDGPVKLQVADDALNILGKSGEVLETVPVKLDDKEGRVATLAFELTSDSEVLITPSDVEAPYGYWGGAGCIPGAGVGAVGTGVATTVGSLVWCIE